MKPYKNHELLTQIAKDSKVYDKPWELYECNTEQEPDASCSNQRSLNYLLIFDGYITNRKSDADQIIADATPHTHQVFIDALNEGKTLDIVRCDGTWIHQTLDDWRWGLPVENYRIHDEYRQFRDAQDRGEKVWYDDVLPQTEWSFDGDVNCYSLTPPEPTFNGTIDKIVELLEGLKS